MKRIVCLIGIMIVVLSTFGCSNANGDEILDSSSIGEVIELYPASLSKLVKYSVERQGDIWIGSFYFTGDMRGDAQLVATDVMLSCFSKALKEKDGQFVYATKVLGAPLKESWQRTEKVEALVYLDNTVVSSQYIDLDVSKKWGKFKSFESIRQSIKGKKSILYDLTRYGQELIKEYGRIEAILFEDSFQRHDGSEALIMRIQSNGFILSEEELAIFSSKVLDGAVAILNKNKPIGEQFRFYLLFQDHGNLGTTLTYSSSDATWTKGLIEDEQLESNQVYKAFVKSY